MRPSRTTTIDPGTTSRRRSHGWRSSLRSGGTRLCRASRRTASFAIEILVSALLVIGLTSPGAEAGQAAGGAGPVANAPAAIDHNSRTSVRTAYQSTLKPALAVPTGWTGNTAGCVAGAPSPAAQNATLTTVNWFREMVGLTPVSFDAGYSADAQQAALMMQAQGSLSHDPDPGWACYTASGYNGASNSNLALGYSSGANAVVGFMRDNGAGNARVGHRRWLLYPPQTTMGAGSTSSATALFVLGTFGARPAIPSWVSWPPPGYVPAQLAFSRWSLSANDPGLGYFDPKTDFSSATVTMSTGGQNIPVTLEPVENGVGDPTLVWVPTTGYVLGGADRTFDVTVNGIVRNGAPTTYQYSVTLFDAELDLPGAPTGATASPGNTQATVSWTAPASNGGSSVTGYTVTSSPGNKTCTWTTGPLSCVITGLTNGTNYTFTVTATNAIGTGGASTPSNAITPASPPGAPSGVAATPGNAQATVSWVAPASNGGSPITGYTVTSSPGNKTCTWTTGPLSCVITGLTNGTNYTFTVTATNAIGTGATSPASGSVTPKGPPGSPTGVGGSTGDSQVTVSWVAPASNGGSPITGYTVTSSPGNKTCTWTTGPLSCVITGLTNGTIYTFTVTATNALGTSPQSPPSPPVSPTTGAGFVALMPSRILDSRDGTGLSGMWGPGQTRELQVVGSGGVPSGATAVVMNVTVTGASAASDLRLWPTGQPVPNVSNLNFNAGQTIPNLVVVKLGTNGKVSIRNNSGQTHVIADVVGYYTDPAAGGPPTSPDATPATLEPEGTAGDLYNGVVPSRILDSRDGTGLSGMWGPGQTRELQVVGSGGVPSGATAVVMNVTVTGASAASDLRLWPTGQPVPNVSNLNFNAGQTIPNLVVVKLGTNGKVSIRNNSGQAHVIADVVGYYAPTGSGFNPLVPSRILDSRDGTGLSGVWGPGQTRDLQVVGSGGVPSGATAVVMNVTVTGASAASDLRLWPAGQPVPNVSNLNYSAGQTIPNLVVVKLGTNGNVSIRNQSGQTHVIADVVGYYAP